MTVTNREGWVWLNGQVKAHYFKGGRSLCEQVGVCSLIILEPSLEEGPDDCPRCQKELQKQIARLE